MLGRCIGAEQPLLPEPAQQVVGQLRTGQHQRIGGELAPGQALEVAVPLAATIALNPRRCSAVSFGGRPRFDMAAAPVKIDVTAYLNL